MIMFATIMHQVHTRVITCHWVTGYIQVMHATEEARGEGRQLCLLRKL